MNNVEKGNDQESIQTNSTSNPKHQTGEEHIQLRQHKIKTIRVESQWDISFPADGHKRYLIGSILTACFAVVIKYLGKYLTICLILSCAKEAIYKRQNSIFIFYINTLKSVLIAVSHASDW